MNKKFVFYWLLGTFFVVSGSIENDAWAAQDLPQVAIIPQISLATPDSAEMKAYLGLDDAKTFTISQIPAKIMIIEFFSVFCPVCHRQAPRANSIFKLIQSDDRLKKDVKMLGIGFGNQENQLPVYARNFNVTFPLFADPEKTIQKKIAVENIPLTVVTDRSGKVLASHLGVIQDVDRFFRELRQFHHGQ
jgi:peroxiredoxin